MTLAISFALVMVWAPVAGILVQTRGVPLTPATRAAARTALRRCLVCAVLATALVAALAATAGAEWPLYVAGGAGFQLIWWVAARPLHRRDVSAVAATDPAPAPSSRRVASLVARDDDGPVPALAWAAPVGFVVLSGAAVAWGAAAGRAEGMRLFGATTLWCGALSFLVAWGLWARAQSRTSQDLSGASDAAEADRLAREFRRFMVRGVFSGVVAATLLFGGAAAAVVWADAAGDAVAWAGALGGAALGLWGGVFGALADRRRRAIIEAGGIPPEPGVRRREDAVSA